MVKVCRWGPYAAVALILVAVIRIASTFTTFSATTDEPSHVAAGMELLQYHRYTVQFLNPPLPRIFMAAPSYLAGVRIRNGGAWMDQLHDVFYNQLPYERSLVLARLGNLLFFVLGAAIIWLIALEQMGEIGALLALFFYTVEPVVLGYSGLATHDGPGIASFALALWAFHEWRRRPRLVSALGFGAAWGFAIACKFSQLIFVPVACAAMLAVSLIISRDSRRDALARLPRTLVVVGVSAPMMVWALYGFTVGRIADVVSTGPRTGFMALIARLPSNLLLPAPRFIAGLAGIAEVDRAGISSYLHGAWSTNGWWWYFPITVLLKTTLTVLILSITGFLIVRRYDRLRALYLENAAAVIALLASTASSKLDLGVRYVLPLYVPLSLIAGSVVLALHQSTNRFIRRTAFAIIVLQIGLSLRVHPDYFPYFNVIASTDPSRYLADSNLDWNQDALRLRDAVRTLRIERLSIASGATTDWQALGFPSVERFGDAYTPRHGWVAVSDHVYRQFMPLGWGWLRGHPFQRVGTSIRLYHLP